MHFAHYPFTLFQNLASSFYHNKKVDNRRFVSRNYHHHGSCYIHNTMRSLPLVSILRLVPSLGFCGNNFVPYFLTES